MIKGNEHHAFQTDPNTLNTRSGKVQYWDAGGSMATAQMPISEARGLVAQGYAWVISDQAIEGYEAQ